MQDSAAALPLQSPETDAFALVPFTDDASDDGGEQALVPVAGAAEAGRGGSGHARTKASEKRARKGAASKGQDGTTDVVKTRGKPAKCVWLWACANQFSQGLTLSVERLRRLL